MPAILLNRFTAKTSARRSLRPAPEIIKCSRVSSPRMWRGHAVDDERADANPSPNGRLIVDGGNRDRGRTHGVLKCAKLLSIRHFIISTPAVCRPTSLPTAPKRLLDHTGLNNWTLK